MAVSWVEQWNNLQLLATVQLCDTDGAWSVLERSSRALERLARNIETQLEADSHHCSQTWFAWGLLDVHVKNLTALVECELVEQFRMILELIEDDIRHLLTCIQRQPGDKEVTRRLVQWTFGRGRTAIQEGLVAVRTITETQVKRVKRRKLLPF
jgi:hypothetical protein